MILTGQQKRILKEGILGAYPNEDELKILLSERMDLRYSAMAKGEDYISRVAFLVEKLEVDGAVEQLIRVVVERKPYSPYLKPVKTEFSYIFPKLDDPPHRDNIVKVYIIQMQKVLERLKVKIISPVWSFLKKQIRKILILLRRQKKNIIYVIIGIIFVVVLIPFIYSFIDNIPELLGDDDAKRFSWGDQILIGDEKAPSLVNDSLKGCSANYKHKKDGVKYFRMGMSQDESINYTTTKDSFLKAKSELEEYTRKCSLDSEAKIYLNNSKVMFDSLERKISPFRIAVVVPISRDKNRGTNESLEILHGIALSQDRIIKLQQEAQPQNELPGFLFGIANDGAVESGPKEERAMAKKIAKHLVHEKNKILGVIGHFSSDSTESAAAIYKAHKMIAVSPTSTAKRRPNSILDLLKLNSGETLLEKLNNYINSVKLNDYIFRTSLNDKVQVPIIVKYIQNWNDHNNTRKYNINQAITIYQDGSIYSKLYKQEFDKIFLDTIKGPVINQSNDLCKITSSPGDSEYIASIEKCINEINKITKNSKDNSGLALMIIPTTEIADRMAINIIDPLLANNYNSQDKIKVFGSDSMYQEDVKNRPGVVIAVTLASEDVDAAMGFGKINWRNGTSYDASETLIQSIIKVYEKNLSDDDKKCFKRTQKCNDLHKILGKIISHVHPFLKNIPKLEGIEGIVGEIKFDENNDRKVDNDIGVLVCSEQLKKFFVKLPNDNKSFCRNASSKFYKDLLNPRSK